MTAPTRWLTLLLLAAPLPLLAQAPAASAAAQGVAARTAAFSQLALRPLREAAAVVLARNDSRI
ncbi:MAG: hypothetical protein Q8N44_20780, partial [Rubrivivax sp.]|nr:hypothetical protein [Rubrivivax sp.]